MIIYLLFILEYKMGAFTSSFFFFCFVLIFFFKKKTSAVFSQDWCSSQQHFLSDFATAFFPCDSCCGCLYFSQPFEWGAGLWQELFLLALEWKHDVLIYSDSWRKYLSSTGNEETKYQSFPVIFVKSCKDKREMINFQVFLIWKIPVGLAPSRLIFYWRFSGSYKTQQNDGNEILPLS